jgi:two-component system, NarL family, sensor histidine kinase BarA
MSESSPPVRTLDELTLGKGVSLDELVDRRVLTDLVQSYYELFGVPLRVFGEDGAILADVTHQDEIYEYLRQFQKSRTVLQDLVTAVKGINPGVDGEISHPCVTGAVYRVVSGSYDARQLGRGILGPFPPRSGREGPPGLLGLDSGLDPAKLRALLAKMPRAREETVAQIARHLKRSLDLILFSGHKALLTSNMHLATVQENFRELQEKNAKLQEMYDRLKELDRLKSNFLATVSHELRTPLTSIIGYSEMLVEGIAGDLNEEQRDFVGTIHGKSEQLLELIKGLLDLSKLESGTMSLRKDNVDIEMVIHDVQETVTPAALKKGVGIGVHVEHGLPLLWGDGGRLRQVLLNLVDNAIKFTPEGGQVRVSAGSTMMEMPRESLGEGHILFNPRRVAVEIRVADTGPGIPEHERARIFDAFYQIDSSSTREQGGTGLGLSIVKRLVEAHDGTVTVEDNAPEGAVFVLVLPCRRATLA